MQYRPLASKKNVIIAGIIAAALLFLAASYFSKRGQQAQQDQQAQGPGTSVQIMAKGNVLPNEALAFIGSQAARYAVLYDLTTSLPLPKGAFEGHVLVVDHNYPLRGIIELDRSKFKVVFTEDPRQNFYGVAVSQPFLDQTGMKIGDTFKMKGKTYQLRGIIESLPDPLGAKLNEGPLLMIRQNAMFGSGMFNSATRRDVHYYIVSRRMDGDTFGREFKARFPHIDVVISK